MIGIIGLCGIGLLTSAISDNKFVKTVLPKLGPLGKHRFMEHKGSINVKTLMLLTIGEGM